MSAARAVYIVSGIPGAGKTTVSRLLAGRLERAVHIEADDLQRMIVSGGRWPADEPVEEGQRQLRLRGHNAALLADSFFEAGFNPVIDDVVIGSRLEEMRTDLRSRPLIFVLLVPEASAVRERDAARPSKHVFDRYGHLDATMRDETPRDGLWLDTSALTAEETVDAILERGWREGRIT